MVEQDRAKRRHSGICCTSRMRRPGGARAFSVTEPHARELFDIDAPLWVHGAETAPTTIPLAELKLAPWGRDELIEYLLAVHPEACKSVMSRIDAPFSTDWNPYLWRLVLDDMSADESLTLEGAFERRFELFEKALPTADKESPEFKRMLVRPFALRLQARVIQKDLEGPLWKRRLLRLHEQPDFREVLKLIGPLLAGDEVIKSRLDMSISKRKYRRLHANAATLLVAMDPLWRTTRLPRGCDLSGAVLDGVDWHETTMTKAELFRASLSSSNLSFCKLDGSSLLETNLSHARLCGASLRRVQGQNVNLREADCSKSDWTFARLDAANFERAKLDDCKFVRSWLMAANFNGASLCGADLSGANLLASLKGADLTNANLDRVQAAKADFRSAKLNRTSFKAAVLNHSDFCGVDFPHAQFPGAYLMDADLTGSKFFAGNLQGANLTHAKLGEIDWAVADLRGADLTGATFHMGTTRSGLLFTPIASEGSRTGFYTDDYLDQNYKPVEEIRSASLRNADLRGANLTNADFYLVDLRGAKLDASQEAYVRKCGAILCEHE
jgi:uncharacterized protein YjbI with pentapeptide repeats